jgi:hypothetical protein
MQTQHKFQLDERDANPAIVMAPYAPPRPQAMHPGGGYPPQQPPPGVSSGAWAGRGRAGHAAGRFASVCRLHGARRHNSDPLARQPRPASCLQYSAYAAPPQAGMAYGPPPPGAYAPPPPGGYPPPPPQGYPPPQGWQQTKY